MSRKRSISTTMSTDKRLNQLIREAGDFAGLLYTWMIPHANDDTTLSFDTEEFMAQVIPMRRDKTVQDVDDALDAMARLGLIIRDYEAGITRFPVKAFYAHQSVINRANRKEDWPEPVNTGKRQESPRNAKNHQGTPENTISSSSSSSSSFSSSVPSLSPSSGATAPSPAKRASRKKAPEEAVSLTNEEIDELATKYADLPEVRDKIALALEHPAHLKYPTGQKRYVNNWLANERERLPRSNGNGYRNGNRPQPTAEDDELVAHLEARTARRLGLVPLPDVRDGGNAEPNGVPAMR